MASIIEAIDHLVYAVTDLDGGKDEIERLLGVRPVDGGRHPTFGTHNALLSLGATTYLEIIARDPEVSMPERGLPFHLGRLEDSRLATWALRSEMIVERAAAAKSGGLDTGAVESGSRRLSDGSLLSWQLTDPYAMPLDGAAPFLISWGTTPHPAETARFGGKLTEFRLEHPEPDRVRHALEVLGGKLDVSKADAIRLVACVETASGLVELY